jgi:hypothetical protein
MSSFIKTAFSAFCLTALVTAAPTNKPRACTAGFVRTPDMYNLYPQLPDKAGSAVSEWHIETFSNKSQLEQAAVFKNIPAEATSCSLMWAQGSRTDRTFLVDGSDALIRVHQLSGFPAEGEAVSYSSVKPFDTLGDKNPVEVDLTAWDTLDATTHIGGTIDCAEEIRLILYMEHVDGDTKALLEQNDKNGLYISYKC